MDPQTHLVGIRKMVKTTGEFSSSMLPWNHEQWFVEEDIVFQSGPFSGSLWVYFKECT